MCCASDIGISYSNSSRVISVVDCLMLSMAVFWAIRTRTDAGGPSARYPWI